MIARNLTDENPAYHIDRTGKNNPMYGVRLCGPANPMYGKRRELSPSWNGGRYTRQDGYVMVVAPDDHPYARCTYESSDLKYILEHRLVMEQHLGRYLLPEEVVHHIDNNCSNNIVENLMLFPNSATHSRHHKKTRNSLSRFSVAAIARALTQEHDFDWDVAYCAAFCYIHDRMTTVSPHVALARMQKSKVKPILTEDQVKQIQDIYRRFKTGVGEAV